MQKTFSVVILAVLMICGGCTLTMHSLFTAKDLVFDPALVGIWTADDATWELQALDESTGRYSLVTTLKDQPPGQFDAWLGVVNGIRFLEIRPKRSDAIHPKTFYGGHFLPLRSFWKVSLATNTLMLTPLSSQWLESMLKTGQLSISFEKPEDGLVILTASTEELQELVTQYAEDQGAFPVSGPAKGLTLNRASEETANH